MAILRGLPGTSADREVVVVRSVAAALAALRSGKAAMAASDGGSINMWIDDDGKYRCNRQRHFTTLDSQTFSTLKQVAEWVHTALPIIQEVPVQ